MVGGQDRGEAKLPCTQGHLGVTANPGLLLEGVSLGHREVGGVVGEAPKGQGALLAERGVFFGTVSQAVVHVDA